MEFFDPKYQDPNHHDDFSNFEPDWLNPKPQAKPRGPFDNPDDPFLPENAPFFKHHPHPHQNQNNLLNSDPLNQYPPKPNPPQPEAKTDHPHSPEPNTNPFKIPLNELANHVGSAHDLEEHQANQPLDSATPTKDSPSAPTTDKPHIPGLPTTGGSPLPQNIKDKFKPHLNNQSLDDVEIIHAPEHVDFVGAEAFKLGTNIYTKEQKPAEQILHHEVKHIVDAKTGKDRAPRKLRRWAKTDNWLAEQAAKEAERRRRAAEAEARRRAEEERKRKAAEAARKKAEADRARAEQLRKNREAALKRRDAERIAKANQPKEQTKPHPQSPTQEQQQLLKVQQSEQKAQAIWKNQPPDQTNLTLNYKNSSSSDKTSYYDQWLAAAKGLVGPGDPKGVDQYFKENQRSLKTLEWLLKTNLNPDLQTHNPALNVTRAAGRGSYQDRNNYYATEYKDYLTPPKDPTREKVQLVALKKGTIEALTGQAPTHGVEIVRQIITKDEKGQPKSTFYTKGKEGWVPLNGLNPDQVIVTVSAPQPQGEQPGTLGSSVNIAGAEQYTHKRYNTIDQNYQTYINPTFTQYQQLRGDTPRQLSGASLRNELGMAMNFTPNNAPMTEAEQKALKEGNWDLFSPDRISPEMAKSMTPQQQEKLRARLKEQHEGLLKVEGKIKEIGGDNAKVTTLPIMVDSPELGGVMQLPLFRVTGKDGKDRFVDNTGRVYDNFGDWKDNNKLPAGRVSYFADGHISSKQDGQPNIVTEKTHAVIDTPWEHIKQVGDWIATGVGIVVGAAAIGAIILGTGGLATPLVIAGGAAALWGAGNAADKLYDRGSHGESLSLADAEARSAWIELAANGVGFAAIGSSIRAGGAISKVMASADEAGMLTASAREVNQAANLARTSQVLNAASTVTDGAALADSTYGLAKGWDSLSPEQRLMAIGQIGFWGGMMAHSSHEAMGHNFYASKDVDAFMHGVGSRPKESLTGAGSPESWPILERVRGTVREGFTLSEADARVLSGMNGDGGKVVELSPELRQQLGIYGKKQVTSEEVLQRVRAIERKNQEGGTATKAEDPKAEAVGKTDKTIRENEAKPATVLERRVSTDGKGYRSTPAIKKQFKEFFGETRYAKYAEEIEALKLKHPELKNIPTEDLVAVRGYTSNDYSMLNKALRSGDPAELERLHAYIKTAESGLSQLPSHQGAVFRGTNLSSEAALKYKPGQPVTEEFFFSTSAERSSAFPGNTKYFVNSANGKRVDFLSEFPHEREVLFPPGTKFDVISIQVNPSTGQREIFMNEIPVRK